MFIKFLASFNQNIFPFKYISFYSVKTSSKMLNGATRYTGFLISLLVIPSFIQWAALPLGPRHMIHNDKMQQTQVQIWCSCSINRDYQDPGIMDATLLEVVEQALFVFCYRARRSDVTLADVSSRSAEPLTMLGSICCWGVWITVERT